jgi:uroporphyrinogen-III synthase
VQAFCLGPITRRSLDAEKLNVVGEASQATLEALTQSLLKAHGQS